MSETPIQAIIEQLRQQEQQLESILAQLNTQVASVSKKLTQVQSAIEALSGQHTSRSSASGSASRRSAPTQAEVNMLVLNFLQKSGPLSKLQLLQLLEAQLLSAGRTKHGLKSKLQKSISQSAISLGNNGQLQIAPSES